MVLALHDRPSDVDVFAYFLARELGRTVAEIEDMPHAEYVNWRAYFTAKHAIENLKPR